MRNTVGVKGYELASDLCPHLGITHRGRRVWPDLISLIGLLLFPDTRSRMYTAIRASLIGIGATGIAVFIYGLNALQTSWGNQYFTFLLHSIFLIVIVAIGNFIVSRTILEKAQPIICLLYTSPSPRD